MPQSKNVDSKVKIKKKKKVLKKDSKPLPKQTDHSHKNCVQSPILQMSAAQSYDQEAHTEHECRP